MFFLPTMNRPGRLQRVLDACVETGMTMPGVVILNGEEQRHLYREVRYPKNWRMTVNKKNLGFNGACQRAFYDHKDEFEWFGCMADDAIPSTPGWDRLLLNEFVDHPAIKIVSANDDWQSHADPWRSRLSPTSVFDAGLLRAMGFWFLPGLWSFYADDVIENIGRLFGCWKILMDVHARHEHVLNGKAVDDNTYRASYGSQDSIAADRDCLMRWIRGGERDACMQRVADYLACKLTKMVEVDTAAEPMVIKSKIPLSRKEEEYFRMQYAVSIAYGGPMILEHGLSLESGGGLSEVADELGTYLERKFGLGLPAARPPTETEFNAAIGDFLGRVEANVTGDYANGRARLRLSVGVKR